jgi:uncharacterized protein YoxC
MSSQWIGIAISVFVMLGGTAVNLFIIGRFVGQWSEAMKNIATTLSKVEERVEATEEQGDTIAAKVGLMDQRLMTAEQAASKFWEMRDEFTRMTVTIEQEGKHSREKLDSLARGQSVIERQLANLVTSKSGFTTLSSEDTNR